MSDVHVTVPHDLTRQEAVSKVKEFESTLQKYNVRAKWKGDHADLKGIGVKGSIDVRDSDVVVVVKLGMIARTAGVDGERLAGSIRKRLHAALNGDNGSSAGV